MMPRLEGHRKNGPATHAAAHAQQRAGSGRLGRRKRRTFEDVHAAPRLARLLEGVVELRRPVCCTRARPHSAQAVRTEICERRRMRGLARECRAIAARETWRFEPIAVCTYEGAQSRCSSMPKRHDSQVGCRDCCRCGTCSWSVCPCRCSSPRAAARSSNLAKRPSAARGCRSPEDPGRARRGISRT